MMQLVRMRGANGEGTQLKKYEELFFPTYVDPIQGIKLAKEFQYRRGDIIQCSYPKCGHHWMNNMLWKLKTPDDSAKPMDSLMETEPEGTYDIQEDPRIIPTHLAANRLYPSHMENRGKVILMLRNPKDVAVSLFYYLKNSNVYKNKQTWDEFLQSYLEGETIYGSYFSYIKEWEQVLQDVQEGNSKLEVEVFHYEDFLLDPKANMARLNKFLNFDRDEQYLNRVVDETTLDALKTRYRNNSEKLVHPTCGDTTGNLIIFRKGQIGDWKNHFTVEQSDMVDRLVNNTLRHDVIKFRF